MQNFKELKREIINRCEGNSTAQGFLKKMHISENKEGLFKFLCYYFQSLYRNGILDEEIFGAFGEDLVNKFGIYYKGEIEKIEGKNIIALCGNVVVGSLHNCFVKTICGTSKTKLISGKSKVHTIMDNSTILQMYGESKKKVSGLKI